MANLGYVGLGVMGGRMTDRLLSKGHSVIGNNRTKSKAQWPIIFVTDPRGTYIELTEGLDKVQ